MIYNLELYISFFNSGGKSTAFSQYMQTLCHFFIKKIGESQFLRQFSSFCQVEVAKIPPNDTSKSKKTKREREAVASLSRFWQVYLIRITYAWLLY